MSSLKALGPKEAADLDAELMSEAGGFSIDQLMELAGLSVSQAVYKVHPPLRGRDVLVVCGPGNNGGDGLVCARHLHHYGYTPAIYYPKPSKPDLFKRLVTQLKNLNLTFIDPEASDPSSDSLSAALESASLIVDSLFGFSFSPPVRAPFDKLISHLESPDRKTPVLSVDIPSSWDVTSGPPSLGQVGHSFMPEFLISLTAPKPCTKYFKGGRHFVGGRFVPSGIADKFGLGDVMSRYEGYEQICEVPVEQEGIGGGGKL